MQSFIQSYHLLSTVFLLADLTLRVGLSIRVIMRRRSHGVSLAWLVVILLFPFIGGGLYLLFGENRISEKRAERIQQSLGHYQHWLQSLGDRCPVNWSSLNPEALPLHHLALSHTGLPAMGGNELQILKQPDDIFSSLIQDIENARSTCHLQFYIWQEGGRVNHLTDALIEAAHRGVTCRILLDAIGSRPFLGAKSLKRLREAGIRIQSSLPAGLVKALFSRIDIRNHRKMVIIDGEIAYTGSQNMADPQLFKRGAGVGQWVDVMVRIRGPVVETMAGTFTHDWFLESDPRKFTISSPREDIAAVRDLADVHQQPQAGQAAVQFLPSGPGITVDAIHDLLLTTIYGARRELILTTPYFVPDEALLSALRSAARRNVDVTIIVPEKNESRLAGFATRARFDQLHSAGVKIQLFQGGFLHSKLITVDNDFALIGSVNLDMRSFWLNFETTLLVYDQQTANQLQELQYTYLQSCRPLDQEAFSMRSPVEKFAENAVLLMGPLL